MSLFGKLLAIVNVLAVVGALALMGMAYGKRTAWQYQVFRQDLMMKGLPVDAAERDQLARSVADQLDEGTRKDLFPSSPIGTQVEEVKRVQNDLQSKISGDKKQQLVVLSRILMPMAVTYAEREELRTYQTQLRDNAAFNNLQARLDQANKAATAQAAGGKAKPYEEAFHDALAAQFADPLGPLAEAYLAARKANAANPLDQALDTQLAQLQGRFNQMFQSAVEGTESDNKKENVKSGATRQKRRIIAYLLFNMVEVLPDEAAAAAAKPGNLWEDANYKRYLRVVGVQAAAEAVNERASLLKQIASEVDTARLRERGVFAEEHGKAVDLVQDGVGRLDRHTRLYDLKNKELQAHEVNLKRRRLDVQKSQEQLAEARKNTAKDLETLRGMSDQLLQQREKLRDATEANQRLEKEIRSLEGVR